MKNLLVASLTFLIISSCNIWGESEVDNDFIFSLPSENLLAWFDASEYNNFDFTVSEIDYWHNKLDGGVGITCSANKPTYQESVQNGLGVVYFPAASPTCSVSLSGSPANYTTFIAMNINQAVATITPFGNYVISTSGNTVTFGSSCGTPDSYMGPSVITFRSDDGAIFESYLNGNFQCSVGGAGTVADPFNLGSNFSIGIQVYEIIVYNRWLENYERQAVENYLMARWDI